ncbi:MAG: RimK/LysX family protein [Cyclobacteriaceae bacterium]
MKTIGRRDKIDFPVFELYDLPVKIDTGAYGCAIHCHYAQITEKDGVEVLAFKVLDPSHPEYANVIHYTADFTQKKVKSSVGVSQMRFAIKTVMKVFGTPYKVTFTLTDRKKMKYPVLIGRKFLNKKFLVDVSLKDLSFNSKY